MSRIKILDGGLGTSLADKCDVKLDHTTPLWSTHLLVDGREDILLSCQQDFVRAGADVLLTATYQASVEGFAATKTPQHPAGIPKAAVRPYLRRAVQVARQAVTSAPARAGKAQHEPLVGLALSLGPYGACMGPGQEYTGRYDAAHDTEDALYQWHRERLRLFAETEGLMEDLAVVALETIPRLDEVRALRRALSASGIKLPFWMSCVFPRDDDLLPDGSTVEQVVDAMLCPSAEGPVPWGIGINCTKMDKLPRLVQAMAQRVEQIKAQQPVPSSVSLVLYPDGMNGKVYNTASQTWELSDALVREQAKVSTSPLVSRWQGLKRVRRHHGHTMWRSLPRPHTVRECLTLSSWADAVKFPPQTLLDCARSFVPRAFIDSLGHTHFNTNAILTAMMGLGPLYRTAWRGVFSRVK